MLCIFIQWNPWHLLHVLAGTWLEGFQWEQTVKTHLYNCLQPPQWSPWCSAHGFCGSLKLVCLLHFSVDLRRDLRCRRTAGRPFTVTDIVRGVGAACMCWPEAATEPRGLRARGFSPGARGCLRDQRVNVRQMAAQKNTHTRTHTHALQLSTCSAGRALQVSSVKPLFHITRSQRRAPASAADGCSSV